MPPKKAAAARPKKDKSASPPTKAAAQAAIAERAGVSKADAVKVLDALEAVMAESLRAHKQFTVNGLIKVVIAHKAATAARPGRNPATGETITIKAKPARKVLRVRALKRLKDLAV